MIEIRSISGEVMLSVPVLEEAVVHKELMASDYVQLAWNSDSAEAIPAGAYVEHEGERYSLLAPYRPERVNELEYKYHPQFMSRVAVWDKHPACIYTYEDDGITIKSREFDWTFAGSPADAIHIALQSVRNETGEDWKAALSDSLPSSIELACQASSILSVISSIAELCETEYWMDMSTNTLHISKCEFGTEVDLEVGHNIGVPSVSASSDKGYYTRYYALGSTRNITQASSGTNSLVNKRLTLDPAVYPQGYKDTKGHYEDGVFVSDLNADEIYGKVVIFDGIYPSSSLEIYDVRPRLKYTLDNGNKVIIGGTDEDPVYEQYAIWYFKIRDFEFNPDSIIAGKKLSVHFKSGQLAGQEFELTYHGNDKEEYTEGDVTRFRVEEGDYEILFNNDSGIIVPGLAYMVPEEGDSVTLFNIEMPREYTRDAWKRLEGSLDKRMQEDAADGNSYEFNSNPIAFNESKLSLSVGRKVNFINGSMQTSTRVLMVERHLDYDFQQKIRVGNNMVKGSSKELREKVDSLNRNVDILKAFNDLSKTIQDNYARTQARFNEALARQLEMFYWADEDKKTIGTKYNFFTEGENAAGGPGEESEGVSGGGIVDTQMSDTSDNAIANRTVKQYIDKTDAALMERIAALELGGGGGGSGENPSGEGDKNYYHTQGVPAEEWIIEHNLGKYPSVTVISSAGEEIYCDKRFPSMNKVVLNFGTAISGAAFLN